MAEDRSLGMSRLARPFAHLNLRHNPFGELEHETFVALAVVDVAEFAKLLNRPSVALQFVGRHGRGKTTRLSVLHALFATAPYTQVYPDEPVPSFSAAPLHFVDSVDHLATTKRRRLFACADRIVVTTHVDLSAEFANAGFGVTTIRVEGVSRELLAEIVRRRIVHARRGPGPIPSVGNTEIDQLIANFGDDLRTIESVLYERFQSL
ncbi:MAG: hypothetical protein ACI8W8_000999 [Rhodothermales bacterium]|jgi:hypothetical protein